MAQVEGEVRSEELDAEHEARRQLALAQIRQYPDPVLRMKAPPVEKYDDDLKKANSNLNLADYAPYATSPVPTVTEPPNAQAIYAVLDGSDGVIRPVHLKAALAMWQYYEDSARFIFGDSIGDPVADTILQAQQQRQ